MFDNNKQNETNTNHLVTQKNPIYCTDSSSYHNRIRVFPVIAPNKYFKKKWVIYLLMNYCFYETGSDRGLTFFITNWVRKTTTKTITTTTNNTNDNDGNYQYVIC